MSESEVINCLREGRARQIDIVNWCVEKGISPSKARHAIRRLHKRGDIQKEIAQVTIKGAPHSITYYSLT